MASDGDRRADGLEISPDWSHLMEQTGGEVEVVCEIVDAYATELQEHAEQLPAELAAGNAAGVRRAAHNVGSAMRTFGLQDAEALARQLESLANDGALEEAGPLVEAVVASAQALAPQLERFVASGGAAARR